MAPQTNIGSAPENGGKVTVPNVPNGGPYVVTVITGNARLNTYLPSLNGDNNSVDITPFTTAEVRVIGAEVGDSNLGTAGHYTFNPSLISGSFFTGVTTSTGVSTIAGDIEGTITASFTSTTTGTSYLDLSFVNGTAGSTASAIASSLATSTGTGTGTTHNIFICSSSASGSTASGSISCASSGFTGIGTSSSTIVSSSAASLVDPAGTSTWGGDTLNISGTIGQSGCLLTWTAVNPCPTTNLLGICKRSFDTSAAFATYYYSNTLYTSVAVAQGQCLNEVSTITTVFGGGYGIPPTTQITTSTVTSTWSTMP